jgi:hypothetical protein
VQATPHPMPHIQTRRTLHPTLCQCSAGGAAARPAGAAADQNSSSKATSPVTPVW